MKTLHLSALAVAALLASTAAQALDNPKPGKLDQRVRYVNYSPANITSLWTTPGGIITLVFSPDETWFDTDSAELTDKKVIKEKTDGHVVVLKPETCLIKEPLTILMRRSNGEVRPYLFQIQTVPAVCRPAANGLVSSVSMSVDSDVSGPGGARFSEEALGPNANVQYAVIFRYPADEAAKRRADRRTAAEKWKREEAKHILEQSTSWDTKDPYSGERNFRYFWRGYASMQPRWVWSNGYSTSIVFPGLQRVPTFAYMGPDGKEVVETNFSMHADTVILPNTHQLWILRDGEQVVGEIAFPSWDVVSSTPGTGTNSPYVQVKVRRHP